MEARKGDKITEIGEYNLTLRKYTKDVMIFSLKEGGNPESDFAETFKNLDKSSFDKIRNFYFYDINCSNLDFTGFKFLIDSHASYFPPNEERDDYYSTFESNADPNAQSEEEGYWGTTSLYDMVVDPDITEDAGEHLKNLVIINFINTKCNKISGLEKVKVHLHFEKIEKPTIFNTIKMVGISNYIESVKIETVSLDYNELEILSSFAGVSTYKRRRNSLFFFS